MVMNDSIVFADSNAFTSIAFTSIAFTGIALTGRSRTGGYLPDRSALVGKSCVPLAFRLGLALVGA